MTNDRSQMTNFVPKGTTTGPEGSRIPLSLPKSENPNVLRILDRRGAAFHCAYPEAENPTYCAFCPRRVLAAAPVSVVTATKPATPIGVARFTGRRGCGVRKNVALNPRSGSRSKRRAQCNAAPRPFTTQNQLNCRPEIWGDQNIVPAGEPRFLSLGDPDGRLHARG